MNLLLEICDCGSLRSQLDQKAFFKVDGSLNYKAVLDTAADIARGMMHLHSMSVIHADLKVIREDGQSL